MSERQGNTKLLIVDDEERLLRVFRLGLKPLGFNIRTANNGEEALQELLDEAFDIVLTDLKMPMMKGDELVFEMERLNIDVPVVVMTAYADVESAVKTLKHGAVDYIKKPFTVDEVADILFKVLDEKSMGLSEIKTLKESVEETEKQVIERMLIKAKQNKAQTSKLLNVSERTLWYKIKKYGLDN